MSAFFNRRSIAFRLIVAVLGVEALFAVLVILLSFGYERHTHFIAFGVMLHGRADSVLGAVQDSEDVQDDLMLDRSDLRLPPEDLWQAQDQDGRILGRSPNWSGPPESDRGLWHDGYLHLHLNHRHYNVLELHGTRLVDPDSKGGGKLHFVTIYYGSPTDRVWHSIWGAVEFYTAGSLLLLVVTGPLMAWVLHRGLLPVRQLATLAGQVSANSWQFMPPKLAKSTPELAPLTEALESVLARLERAFTQQRVFVSDAAHELKTAVAVVKSSLQLLSLRPRNVSEYQAGLERCLTDAERLEELVGQMLTLARVESADRNLPVAASCELSSCVERAAKHLEPVAELREVKLRVQPSSGDDPAVPLGEEDCLILVSNLLLNALQHSQAGATVRIALEGEPDRIRLSVQDQGEGIDPAALPHVFDRFYRGDPSRNRATGGAGLGLAICKAIVDRAGGSIIIENCATGGASVSVFLPAAPRGVEATCTTLVQDRCAGSPHSSRI